MSQMKPKMPKSTKGRRANNVGSIYQRGGKGRWYGLVTVGYDTSTGKPIRNPYSGATEREVAMKIAAATNDVFVNGYTNISADSSTNFQVLMLDWFDLFNAPNIASSTEYNRRNMMKNHIFKAFGKYDVQDVTLEKLQKFFNGKIKGGMAADSVHKMKDMLKLFFKYAKKKNLIKENPMEDILIRCKVQYTAKGSGTKKALREEVRGIVFKGVAENPLLKPKVLVLAFTGMRPQEILALEWKHINFDKNRISIEQAVNRFYVFDELGNKISSGEDVGDTKTLHSVRDITVAEIVFEVLHAWQVYCKEHNIVSKYVFPNTKTGKRLTYSGLRTQLDRFVKKHGLEDEKITLYSFRHPYVKPVLKNIFSTGLTYSAFFLTEDFMREGINVVSNNPSYVIK